MFDPYTLQVELTNLLSFYASQDRRGQEFEVIIRRRGERRRLATVTAVPRPADAKEPPKRTRRAKNKGG